MAGSVVRQIVLSRKYENLTDDEIRGLSTVELLTAVDHLKQRPEYDQRLFQVVSNTVLQQEDTTGVSGSSAKFCFAWSTDAAAADRVLFQATTRLWEAEWLELAKIGLHKNFGIPSVGKILLEIVMGVGIKVAMKEDDRRLLLEAYIALEVWLSLNPDVAGYECVTRYIRKSEDQTNFAEMLTGTMICGNRINSSLQTLLVSSYLRNQDDLFLLENSTSVIDLMWKVMSEIPDRFAATIAGILVGEVLPTFPGVIDLLETDIGTIFEQSGKIPAPLLLVLASQEPTVKFTGLILDKVEYVPSNFRVIRAILRIRKEIPKPYEQRVRSYLRTCEAMRFVREASVMVTVEQPEEPLPENVPAGAEWILAKKASLKFQANWAKEVKLRGRVSDVIRQVLALTQIQLESEDVERLKPTCFRWLTADVEPALYNELCELEFLF